MKEKKAKSKASASSVNPFHPFSRPSVDAESIQSASQQRWDEMIRVDLCYHLEVLAAAVGSLMGVGGWGGVSIESCSRTR